MVRGIHLIGAALMALGACSKPAVDAKNATPAEVASQVAAAGGADRFINPGQWRTTMTIEDMNMAGAENLPPAVLAQMKKRMAAGTTVEACVTPEQAKKPDAATLAGQKNCTYNHFTMAGGKIDAEMTCGAGKVMQHMTMTGSYSPDSYEIRSKVDRSGAAAPGDLGMSMTMHMQSKRIGECAKG